MDKLSKYDKSIQEKYIDLIKCVYFYLFDGNGKRIDNGYFRITPEEEYDNPRESQDSCM